MKKEILDRIEIQQGDITRLKLDAIVNAANTSLLGGGGVDGAIHRAAGPELLAECRKIGGCPTGEARLTQGYNLPARYVIHTVGPVYTGKAEDSRLLSLCYRNSLRLAVENHITSIAFPAISCGVYGYPIEEACKIAVDTTCEFLNTNSTIQKVIFILFSSDSYDVYKNHLGQLRMIAFNNFGWIPLTNCI
ncbi:MAG: O-acetyl-ADP-ribose deacetylase [Proteobacteria bacterium]|nr:O-acetyl-ADP-ribose deacetylase [Pseudomonadota bacterium]